MLNTMWTDIKNNTNMGLQSSLATKRKHELTLTSEKELEYQSSCPPIKTTKWSSDSDNNTQENNNNNINSNNNNNNNNDSNNNQEQQQQKQQLQRQTQDSQQTQENNLNENNISSSNLIKLEVVTATPNDLWNPEPVDCISKLQAVAVPTDTWGSLTTRSTLATTLLSADELEDDDDDFDDDYEEEESIIPTYCPVRYSCPPPHFLQRNGGNNNNNNNTNNNSNNNNNSNGNNGANSYTTHNTNNISHSYIGKPNYYSEPFPQQNCSRTINQQQQQSQHFRFGTLNSWNHLNSHQNNSYYNMQTVEPILPIGSSNGSINGSIGYTQQTIRCAENGKSYLELGSSTFTTTNLTPNNSNHNNNLNIRHSKKCGCDGRGTWCNNKNCYRDIRMKIRNLSMFKLSKFRQVSEQSLYRSVLICNTLKNIDREIELENKDSHHLHHNLPHHMSPHLHHPLNPHHHHNSPLSSLVNNNNNDFSPIGSCTKVCAIQHDPNNSLAFQPINQFGNINNTDNESIREYNIIQQQHQQQQQHQHQQQSMLAKSSSSIMFSSSSNVNQHCPNELLHPYDHYPFREAQLGRATPFPVGSSDSENTDNIPITSQSLSSLSNNNSISNISNSINFASNSLPIVSNSISQTSTSSLSLTTTTLTPIINSTPTAAMNQQQNSASISPESDSGFSDDDSNRSINWSSVLSLSSQSALDPLNNNDLYSILPSPAIPTPISTTSTSLICNNNISNNSSLNTSSSSTKTVATNSTLTSISNRSNQINNDSTSNNNSISSTSSNNNINSNSTTHVTTLSTLTTLTSSSSSFPISITTTTNHQLLENNNNCSASSIQTNNSTWEYNFLDMDLGISSSELTELVPPHHCKLTSDDLFKSISTPLNTARYVHDNEIESPAHIMVGS